MRSFNFLYLGLWLTRLVGSVGILAIGVGLAWGQDVPLLPGERGLPIYPSPPPMQEAEPQLNEKLIDTTYYPEPFSIPASIRNTLLGDTTLGDSIDKFLPDTLGDTLKRRNLNKLSPFPRQDSPQLSIKKAVGRVLFMSLGYKGGLRSQRCWPAAGVSFVSFRYHRSHRSQRRRLTGGVLFGSRREEESLFVDTTKYIPIHTAKYVMENALKTLGSLTTDLASKNDTLLSQLDMLRDGIHMMISAIQSQKSKLYRVSLPLRATLSDALQKLSEEVEATEKLVEIAYWESHGIAAGLRAMQRRYGPSQIDSSLKAIFRRYDASRVKKISAVEYLELRIQYILIPLSVLEGLGDRYNMLRDQWEVISRKAFNLNATWQKINPPVDPLSNTPQRRIMRLHHEFKSLEFALRRVNYLIQAEVEGEGGSASKERDRKLDSMYSATIDTLTSRIDTLTRLCEKVLSMPPASEGSPRVDPMMVHFSVDSDLDSMLSAGTVAKSELNRLEHRLKRLRGKRKNLSPKCRACEEASKDLRKKIHMLPYYYYEHSSVAIYEIVMNRICFPVRNKAEAKVFDRDSVSFERIIFLSRLLVNFGIRNQGISGRLEVVHTFFGPVRFGVNLTVANEREIADTIRTLEAFLVNGGILSLNPSIPLLKWGHPLLYDLFFTLHWSPRINLLVPGQRAPEEVGIPWNFEIPAFDAFFTLRDRNDAQAKLSVFTWLRGSYVLGNLSFREALEVPAQNFLLLQGALGLTLYRHTRIFIGIPFPTTPWIRDRVSPLRIGLHIFPSSLI